MKALKIITSLVILFITHINYSQEIAKQNAITDPDHTISSAQARYSYYPNIEAYYDIQKNVYIFKSNNGDWTVADEIPSGYRGYSLFNKINIKIYDYDGETPQEMIKIHKVKHPFITNGRTQKMTASED